jgi:flavorubredoxin
MRLFNFRAELFSNVGERLKVRTGIDYFEYTTENELEAWHLPTLQIDLSVKYNIQDKIILSADAFARNSVYARVFDETGNVQREEIHGFHVDANLGIEYRYTKILSVFLKLNNIQNQRLEKWYNYPSQKFNFMGGVTYAF